MPWKVPPPRPLFTLRRASTSQKTVLQSLLLRTQLRPRLPLCILFFSSTFGSLFSLEFLFVCSCRTDAIIGCMSIWFFCWRYNYFSVLELTIIAFINIFAITFHEVLNFISFDFFYQSVIYLIEKWWKYLKATHLTTCIVKCYSYKNAVCFPLTETAGVSAPLTFFSSEAMPFVSRVTRKV